MDGQPQGILSSINGKNYFTQLHSVDVSKKVEKKGNLHYLSWAWAWGELKKVYPDATSKVYEREDGRIYWDDGKTAWVKTGVTVNGIEHVEYLPIMNAYNKSLDLSSITSFEVNKSIQRSITKAIARHGLGLDIYAGEDLPEPEKPTQAPAPSKPCTPRQIERISDILSCLLLYLPKTLFVRSSKTARAALCRLDLRPKKRAEKTL